MQRMRYMMLQQDILHCVLALRASFHRLPTRCSRTGRGPPLQPLNILSADGRGFSRCWPRAPSPACRCPFLLKQSHASAGVWEEQTAESLSQGNHTKGVAAFCHFQGWEAGISPNKRRRSVKLQASALNRLLSLQRWMLYVTL